MPQLAEARARLGMSSRDAIADWALRLVRVPSPNPPLATAEVAAAAAAILREAVADAEIALHDAGEGVTNLVARVRGAGPGRRVVFNGHLDTYPVGDPTRWTRDPEGEIVGDRLYGRGAADMKGGIAADIAAFASLAAQREAWPGEVVLTLAGDEESMGALGTQWLLEHVQEARGDAVLIADAGSPRVLRFGEKGFLWLEVEASGRAAHGAHVHLGENAVELLLDALTALRGLRALNVAAPDAVTAAIARSQPISEPLAGAGEAAVLGSVTVNIGRVEGGTSTNLVPSAARAGVDVRVPVGLTTQSVERALERVLDRPGIRWRILRRVEPNYTDPESALVRRCKIAAEEVIGTEVAVNMRVGASDARLFRIAGLPALVYGPTPHGMGGGDEWADLRELEQVARVHALTAFDLLTGAE
ncbi:MAG TPA: M20/M25/M40 family metallo-hydrolase [Acetobacteraceae bacterium]|nr:M20/M25/M40 family metallo-hydrolase [Acetobacteraceae bacterium]